MLNRDNAVLLFIDVQGRLHEIMVDKELLDTNLEKLIRATKLLGIPIIGTEQVPDKMGSTSEPFLSLLEGATMIGKTAFSCYGEKAFVEALKASGKKQAILCGIETHICLYQTAIDLLEHGVDVFVVADAVSSRIAENRTLALDAMRQAGAVVLPTESILMALQKDAAEPTFKEMLKLIK